MRADLESGLQHGTALEGVLVLGALAVQRHLDDGRQPVALQRGHAVFVQQRHLRADQALVVQPPHPPQRGGRRDAGALGQCLVALGGIVLQGGQQGPIGVVWFHI